MSSHNLPLRPPSERAGLGSFRAVVDGELRGGVPRLAEVGAERGPDAVYLPAVGVDEEDVVASKRYWHAVLAGDARADRLGPRHAVGRSPGDVDVDISAEGRVMRPVCADVPPGLGVSRYANIPEVFASSRVLGHGGEPGPRLGSVMGRDGGMRPGPAGRRRGSPSRSRRAGRARRWEGE